jgi:hypothetical protein
LPWFDYYSDNSTALKGSEKLSGLKSVVEMGKEKKILRCRRMKALILTTLLNFAKDLRRAKFERERFDQYQEIRFSLQNQKFGTIRSAGLNYKSGSGNGPDSELQLPPIRYVYLPPRASLNPVVLKRCVG